MPCTPRIHGDESPAGSLPGVRFDLAAQAPTVAPRLVVEAKKRQLIVRIEDRDHLFARVHPHTQGVRVGIAPGLGVGALPPIYADDVRSVAQAEREGARHGWARWFAHAVAQADLFGAGSYAITAACDGTDPSVRYTPSAVSPSLAFLDPVAPCLDSPAVSWMDWFGDDREVLRLRSPSRSDAARVKAWRKRARDGTLPPLLLWFVAGLDTCVLLDGHDRLLAAREEGVTPRLLVLWRHTLRRRSISVAHQEGLLGELRSRRERPTARRLPLETDQENQLLLEAFPPPARLHPTTRAVALRGGAAAFEERARAALGTDVDERFLAGREPVGERNGCGQRCAAELGWAPGS